MKTKVYVTKKDIEKGKKNSCESCPVSLALRRYINCDKWIVHVNRSTFSFVLKYGEIYDVCEIPHNLYQFTVQFNRGKPVKAFKFDVDLPKEILKG